MREGKAATHTQRGSGWGRRCATRERRCDRAIEWKTEMLMRWSGSAGEPASDLPRKPEGEDATRGEV